MLIKQNRAKTDTKQTRTHPPAAGSLHRAFGRMDSSSFNRSNLSFSSASPYLETIASVSHSLCPSVCLFWIALVCLYIIEYHLHSNLVVRCCTYTVGSRFVLCMTAQSGTQSLGPYGIVMVRNLCPSPNGIASRLPSHSTHGKLTRYTPHRRPWRFGHFFQLALTFVHQHFLQGTSAYLRFVPFFQCFRSRSAVKNWVGDMGPWCCRQAHWNTSSETIGERTVWPSFFCTRNVNMPHPTPPPAPHPASCGTSTTCATYKER